MNILKLSECGLYVQWWNNGQKMRQAHIALCGGVHAAVKGLKHHAVQWTGRLPDVEGSLQCVMDQVGRMTVELSGRGTEADHGALLAIQDLMDGVEWTPDTLDRIASILTDAWYPIRDKQV